MCFDVGWVIPLNVRGSTTRGDRVEEVLPHAALSPSNEAVVDGGRRAVLRGYLAPLVSGLQNMQDTAYPPSVAPPLSPARQWANAARPEPIVRPTTRTDWVPFAALRIEGRRI